MIPRSAYERSIQQFLAPVASLMNDPTVSEILINGPDRIFAERQGRLLETDAHFPSQHALLCALRNIAQYLGRECDDEHPILEGHLPDGSRIEAVLPPIAAAGPTVAIRRFSKERLTLQRLLSLGALNDDVLVLLRKAVSEKQNILVSGGTGSGKTSLLNAISALIPGNERVVVLEDAQELQLQGDHVVQLGVRPKDAAGRGEVTMRDLLKATLRLRPDRIVIGEIRGPEALELTQIMTSGHGGCLSTIHASYPKDALQRLETLAMMSDVNLPLFALRGQIASGINLIVQTDRKRDGRRGITQVTRVIGCDANAGYQLQDLFTRDEGDSFRSPGDSQCNTPALSPAQRLAFHPVANGPQQRVTLPATKV
ncbi:MAG TPA: CpaF family protein [Polyangiaceae bacterium]|nr:CpaF family protein [Polyangiaceae bacterium]